MGTSEPEVSNAASASTAGGDKGGGAGATDPSAVVRAAGGIVVRASSSGGWEVALIHRPIHQDWSLPKGKLEPGETAEECALREVLEETGWRCVLGRFAGEVEYLDRRARPKVVEYWLMQPIEGGFPRFDEVDELVWLPVAQGPARLSYEHDRALLASVAGAMEVPGFDFGR